MLIQLKAENEALKARVAEREAAKEIAALMAENAALKAQLGEDDEVTIVEDAPAPPKKEKRPPSAWCHFSARVVKVVRASGWTGPQTLIWTVAAQVKAEKGYDCTDADIMAAWDGREPPALLMPEPKPKKVKKPQSEETKAAAALKRAATKAAKAAAAAAVVAPEPAPAPKKAMPKPKKVDLALYLVGEEDQQYYTNQRGDCVSTDGEWLGRLNGDTIDTTVPEPADFDTLQLRE